MALGQTTSTTPEAASTDGSLRHGIGATKSMKSRTRLCCSSRASSGLTETGSEQNTLGKRIANQHRAMKLWVVRMITGFKNKAKGGRHHAEDNQLSTETNYAL